MEKKTSGTRGPTGRREFGGGSQGRSLRKGLRPKLVRGEVPPTMTSTGQDSTTTRQRRSRHSPHSPPHDSGVTSRGVKKGATLRSSPNLAEDLNLEAKTLSGTGLVFDEQLNDFHCLWDDSFPEGPERLHAIKEQLIQESLMDRCVSFQARFAEKEELMLVHSLEYIDLMETTQYMNEGELRILADTYDSVYLHPNSYTCACLASGSVLRLVDAVLGAEIRNGMAIIRPPGHHAQHSLMDGYCMFNHVAVAARYAQQKHDIQRVLIVDWDVHHGQGTQFTFDQDPSVLYFSIHRYEQGRFWPHLKTSDWSTTGFGQGQGYTINVPWNQVGMRDADYIAAFLHILLPVALEFQPQLVLVAAGFDALQGDPKGEMAATPAGFAQLTHLLMGLAGGKLILSLEGGYNLRSLAEGVSASLHTLLGDPCPMLESPGAPCPSAQASLSCTLEALEPFWEVLVRSVETVEEDDVEGDNVEEKEEGPGQPPALPVLTWPVLQARTGLVYDQRMMGHYNLWDSHHPEMPQRISRIMRRLEELGLAERCLTLPARPATDAELLTCHSAEYVGRLRATEKMKTRELHREGANFDSIYICPSTFACAQLATGAVCRLVEAVLAGEVLNGIAVVRPPGHHAEQDAACGFCFFNSVAVAARHAQTISGHALRILIVDWDVHHGNGTQHIFEEDPSVLYISLHRYDHGTFFPMGDEGTSSQMGRAAGTGFTVNVTWNGPRMGDADYLAAWHRLVLPIAYEFNPELVLVSAGFDAARGDPLGGCQVSPEGYAHLTHLLMGLANGRIILILEGGYNLTSISESMAACTRSLLGDPPPLLTLPRPPLAGALASITETIQVHRRYWRSLRITKVEDKEGPSSSKSITKKAPQPANLGSAKEMTTSEGNILDAGTEKATSVSSVEESTPGETKSETAMVELTQDKSLEAATGKATLDQTISETATGEATLDQTTSETATGKGTLDQTTSETATGKGTLDQTTSETATGEATLDQTTSETAMGKGTLDQTTSETATGEATLDQSTSETATKEGTLDQTTSETATGEATLDQTTSETATKEGTLGQTTSETATGEATLDQTTSEGAMLAQTTSEAATGGATLDQTTSEAATGGATLDQTTSEIAMVGAKLDQATSEIAMRGAMLDQTTLRATTGGATLDKTTSEIATGGAMLDQTTLGATTGGATLDETSSEIATGGAMLDQTTSGAARGGATLDQTTSEAVRGAELIQIPPASYTDNQTSPASPVEGATPQISPSKLIGNLRTLELDNEAQEAPVSQIPEEERLLGEAAGGQDMDDSVLMQSFGVTDQAMFYAVTPLPWCPHLVAVSPIPEAGLDVTQPCQDCGALQENWVCLSCYQVYCGRYINAHMLQHHEGSGHPLVLSYVDLSTWCYYCQAYVHHQALLEAKNVAHQNKFGEGMPPPSH
ncbi:histone deacetylase 6 isoform X4 [Diceros bicornis minor]|uniref:histone deacetylase 6 isoform X4 n=1 Tax=Diceros bicornis minor TaxID=77932 RepID=UPI0026EB1CF1|nr:histone deacetylase 6 isoform X4 [Diceros bicornis minor]